MRRWIRRVLNVLGGTVGVVLVLVAVAPRVLPYQTFYVRTASMAPALPVGSLVVATRVPAPALHVGDVITFADPDRAGGQMVTHRIVGIEQSPKGDLFLTKGDANDVVDPWRVPAVGSGWRKRFAVPVVGYAVGLLQANIARPGVLTALMALAMVLVLGQIWGSSKRRPEPATT